MRTIKEEIKSYNIKYEAIDGTIFYNKEECENYERTAKAIIRSKFLKLVVKQGTEMNIFNVGSDDCLIYFVKMSKVSDADAIKQLYLSDHSWCLDSADHQHYIDEAFTTIDEAYKKKDILLIGENYEGETYIIGTKQSIIDGLNNLKK